MVNARKLTVSIILFLISIGFCIADNAVPNTQGLFKKMKEVKVEIAPGKWVAVQRIDWCYDDDKPVSFYEAHQHPERYTLPEAKERTLLTIPWNQSHVTWEGVEIPVSLREWKGKLFLIGYDRETNRKKLTLRYYAQNDTKFDEIKPNEYPKRIATQNLWLGGPASVEVAVKCDPEDIYFANTITAKVWCQLMTGKEYNETVAVEQSILRAYVKKYNPIRLHAIIPSKEQRQKKETEAKERKGQ